MLPVSKCVLGVGISRALGTCNFNPTPYNAEYMGHKLHMDQNEKLVMFGVTHVVALDGQSKKIVANATMPAKNNLAMYEEVYRPAVTCYGMWDQLRVDHGKEFYLCLYMQERSEYRHNQQREPYRQTQSTREILAICKPSAYITSVVKKSHSGKDVARNQQPGKLPTKGGPGTATRSRSNRYRGQPDKVLHIQSDLPDVPYWYKQICAFMECSQDLSTLHSIILTFQLFLTILL
ncbi:uncharacterized protein LOC127430693 isoform X1 [Myxocyprinus asiaticus]|uniref:uncharacterized protein LOC127430693 isoform X1 n=1 Tax=Myxocyprinus asiaticus TaxID=70543 RepID=UPI0022239D8E|nr:uncharacterized protein LOC127430693 isoform X1 [Myxocyprinus asiaticus]